MGDIRQQSNDAFVVCRETTLLPKRIFDIFSGCRGLIRVELIPNAVSNVSSYGGKTAYVKFADAASAKEAKDTIEGEIICQHPLELAHSAPVDLDETMSAKTNSWDHADQAKWGGGNNALVASIMKVLSTKQTYDTDVERPRKLVDFKIVYDEEINRIAAFFPGETTLERQKRLCKYFRHEMSLAYHQLLEGRVVLKTPQDLDIAQSKIPESTFKNLLIDFRTFAEQVENMRRLRTILHPKINLPARKDDLLTKNLFAVGDFLTETKGSLEIPVVFQERMFRCLHDDLEMLYAGETGVNEQWEDILGQAVAKENAVLRASVNQTQG